MDVWTLAVVIISAVAVVCASEETSGVSQSVETNIGTIIGFQKDVDVFGKAVKVTRFLGIPYAEPPVGELRFEKPVPKAKLASPLIAKKHGNVCLQHHLMPVAKEMRDSEDCLFLNVYAPESSRNGGLPVMIWIHGGAFVAGAADAYAADTMAGLGDVIIVTFNYRLSIWGFFSTGSESGSRNYGLWDQHFAIRWVHENIEAFGGDVNRVTIFGESAGSASVVYQSLYEGNTGLFQRAIGQSGGITGIWASTSDFTAQAKKLGSLVGCADDDLATLQACIKYTPAAVLNSTLNNDTNNFIDFLTPSFIPVAQDGEFIQDRKRDIFTSNNEGSKHSFFSSLDLMMGMNSAEGATAIMYLLRSDTEDFLPNRTEFEENLVPLYLKSIYGDDVPEAVILATIAQYTDWSDPENSQKIRDNFVQFSSDMFMTANIMETINFHANHSGQSSRTYIYQFDVRPSYHLAPAQSWLQKANHADELFYLFGHGDDGMLSYLPEENPKLKQWEMQLAKDMMIMWTNFAKTGDPNQPTSVRQLWPQYDLATQANMDITGDSSSKSVKQYQFARNSYFWNKIIPSIFDAVEDGKEPSTRACTQDTCKKDSDCSP